MRRQHLCRWAVPKACLWRDTTFYPGLLEVRPARELGLYQSSRRSAEKGRSAGGQRAANSGGRSTSKGRTGRGDQDREPRQARSWTDLVGWVYGCTYRANGGHAYRFGAVALGVTYRGRRGIIFGTPCDPISLAEGGCSAFREEASQRAFTYLAAAVPESLPTRRCVLRW